MPKARKLLLIFKPLERILSMDFTQLRALECAGGHCASKESIKMLVDNLLEFFSRFKEMAPNKKQRIEYKSYMEQITQKINKAEHAYYLAKYTSMDPENAEQMATRTLLKSFKDLPTRMQYWAASTNWGDPIRNAQSHCAAVKALQRWADLVDSLNFAITCSQSFFQQPAAVTDDAQYAEAAAAATPH